jgi:hypothetical protein
MALSTEPTLSDLQRELGELKLMVSSLGSGKK